MAKLKLDISDKLVADTMPPEIINEPQTTLSFKQKSPSDWAIRPGEKTEIIANSNLGDKFEGTIAEFNKLLRA